MLIYNLNGKRKFVKVCDEEYGDDFILIGYVG